MMFPVDVHLANPFTQILAAYGGEYVGVCLPDDVGHSSVARLC